VKIYKEGVNGREQIVKVMAAPGFLGYRPLFGEDVYIASSEALEDCVVIYIPKDVEEKIRHLHGQEVIVIVIKPDA